MTFQKSFVLAVMGIITLCLSSCFEEDKYVVPMLFQGFCDVNDSSFIDNYEGKYNSAVIHPIYEKTDTIDSCTVYFGGHEDMSIYCPFSIKDLAVNVASDEERKALSICSDTIVFKVKYKITKWVIDGFEPLFFFMLPGTSKKSYEVSIGGHKYIFSFWAKTYRGYDEKYDFYTSFTSYLPPTGIEITPIKFTRDGQDIPLLPDSTMAIQVNWPMKNVRGEF